MTMINANVMKAVGEVLESHGIRVQPGERMPDALARGLGLTDGQAHQWLDALSEGCTVEEANARVGVADHRDQPLLVAVARAVGKALGRMAGGSSQ
jgi:hypothetical protein